jgi:pyridoxal/pyridoxine/pyridoxamine kinase
MAISNKWDGWSAETMSFGNEPKLKHIKLKDATEEEMEEFYKHYSDLKQEFERIRPMGYFSNLGGFACDPLLAHYKYFLLEKGIQYISIKDNI